MSDFNPGILSVHLILPSLRGVPAWASISLFFGFGASLANAVYQGIQADRDLVLLISCAVNAFLILVAAILILTLLRTGVRPTVATRIFWFFAICAGIPKVFAITSQLGLVEAALEWASIGAHISLLAALLVPLSSEYQFATDSLPLHGLALFRFIAAFGRGAFFGLVTLRLLDSSVDSDWSWVQVCIPWFVAIFVALLSLALAEAMVSTGCCHDCFVAVPVHHCWPCFRDSNRFPKATARTDTTCGK